MNTYSKQVFNYISKHKFIKYSIYSFLLLTTLGIIFVISLFVFAFTYPIEDKFEESKNEIIDEYKINYKEIDNIEKDFLESVVRTEDRRFYSHNGFDIIGILRAVKTNILSGEIEEGGSTITQQVAKNLFLTNEQTYTRKFKELYLSFAIDLHYDKETILETYVNINNYGNGAFGIENASYKYFGKSSNDLLIEESTLLAGLPNGPSIYDPYKNMDLTKKKQNEILNNLVETGYITKEDSKDIFNKTLNIQTDN